jgi:hypothetical protein
MPDDPPRSDADDGQPQAPSANQLTGSVSKPLNPKRNAPSWRLFTRSSRPEPDPNAIGEMRFIQHVTTLIMLKAFLLNEGVHIRVEDTQLFSFGTLNQLRYSDGGRLATLEEWGMVDERLQKLFGYLDDDLRKRFRLRQTANLIAGVPVALMILALLSLLAGTLTTDRNALLGLYFVWTAFLGGLGSIGFLSMNALSIQTDATFDLTNHSLLAVRIVLGSLFGVVLSIPFGFDSFVTFCQTIGSGAAQGGQNTWVSYGVQATLLLMPFILGFSTSLVILILNRFVESIGVFFGQGRDGK